MDRIIADWPRPHYEQPGGRPFLFYLVYGQFSDLPGIESKKYRSLGVPTGLEMRHYERSRHPDFFSGFEEGYLWDELSAQDPASARRISGSNHCLVLHGELEDRDDLNYLRDSVGLMTFLLNNGGICVHDPEMFRWWRPEPWRLQIFEPGGPVPRQHVLILTSEEDGSGRRAVPRTWFHTRGMRKFGRPDLSIHDVPPRHHRAVIDLLNRFIEFQAFGGAIEEGREIVMDVLPAGMTCHHGGDPNDPDFNNHHVEITMPNIQSWANLSWRWR